MVYFVTTQYTYNILKCVFMKFEKSPCDVLLNFFSITSFYLFFLMLFLDFIIFIYVMYLFYVYYNTNFTNLKLEHYFSKPRIFFYGDRTFFSVNQEHHPF